MDVGRDGVSAKLGAVGGNGPRETFLAIAERHAPG